MLLGVALGLALIGGTVLGTARGQEVGSGPEEGLARELVPQYIVVEPPAHPGFQVSLWVDRQVYYPGDSIRIHLSLSRQAYVYVVDHDTRGETRLVFPNRYDGDNFFWPGTHTLPRRGETFRVEGPPGVETLQLIASSRPLRPFQVLLRAHPEGAFPLIDEPDALRDELEQELQPEPPHHEWATVAVSFRVAGRGPFWPPRFPRNQPPVARFSFWPARPVAGEPVEFDGGSSYDPDGHITAYEWDLDGDGHYDAAGAHVSWRYDTSGHYPVTLRVVDDAGAATSRTQTLLVGPGQVQVRVEIDSRPRGARIFVDGEYRGRTPRVLFLDAGVHHLRLEGPRNHGPWEMPLDLTGLEALQLRVAF